MTRRARSSRSTAGCCPLCTLPSRSCAMSAIWAPRPARSRSCGSARRRVACGRWCGARRSTRPRRGGISWCRRTCSTSSVPVLAHRLVLTREALLAGVTTTEDVVTEVVDRVRGAQARGAMRLAGCALTPRGVVPSCSACCSPCSGCGGGTRGWPRSASALMALVVAAVVSVLMPAPVQAARTVRPRTVHRLARVPGARADEHEPPAPVRARRGGPDRRHADRRSTCRCCGPARSRPSTTRSRPRGAACSPSGPLTLRRTGLAGLAGARTVLGDVDPRCGSCPGCCRCAGCRPGRARGQVGADERVERGGTDLVGLREYVPGDDLRRLHWATQRAPGR